MEIGKKQAATWEKPAILLGVLLLAFGLGLLVGQGGGLTQVRWGGTAVFGGRGSDLPVLSLDLPFENYDALLAQRDEGLATGVFVGSEDDFVNGGLMLDGETVPVRLRLQQGVADHLGEDEKWHFEVRTRQQTMVRGMSRFRLVDPADHDWLREWAFLQTVRQEGLLVGQYAFVRLRFNGTEQGIYALQEQASPELLATNGRLPGVIIEFDVAPIWRTMRRVGGSPEAVLADPVFGLTETAFQILPIDTVQETAVLADPALAAQQASGVELLRGLQTGELSAVDLFDVTQYGRFLALADLWGAADATLLTNLRFYYDPELGRLEPIVSGGGLKNGRVSLEATYYDAELQLAYAAAVAEYSDPTFVAELEVMLGEEWLRLQQSVGSEVSLMPPWAWLAERQAWLWQSLDPMQPVVAFAQQGEVLNAGELLVWVANPLQLPLELVGFDLGGATFLEMDAAWVRSGGELLLPQMKGVMLAAQGNKRVQYVQIGLPLAAVQDAELQGNGTLMLSVATRIVGSEAEVRLTAVQPIAP